MIASSASNAITIATNGGELKISKAVLSAGETLVVDADKLTAYVEDAEGSVLRNGLPYLAELSFPVLNPGDNTVTVTATNAVFTELKIQANSRWR